MSRSATLPIASEGSEPAGFVRCVLWVGVAGWVGTIFAALALLAPSIAGVATVKPGTGARVEWFPVDTLGGFCANVAVLATLLWGCTWAVRGVFRVRGGPVPASTWTALTLAPALVLAVTPLTTTIAAGIGAAITLS